MWNSLHPQSSFICGHRHYDRQFSRAGFAKAVVSCYTWTNWLSGGNDMPLEHTEERLNSFDRGSYFVWIRENLPRVSQKSKTWESFQYSIYQERYMKVFLDSLMRRFPWTIIPLSSRFGDPISVRRNEWWSNTITGVKASAIIYSSAETAKANGLKLYDYFEYYLTELLRHLDNRDPVDFWMICSSDRWTCRRVAENSEKEKRDKDWSKSVSIIQVCSNFVQLQTIYHLRRFPLLGNQMNV